MPDLYTPDTNAFMVYARPSLDEKSFNQILFELYQESACYARNSYTSNTIYNKQLSTLIDKFVEILSVGVEDMELREKIELLKQTLKETNYVSQNQKVQAAYYHSYKKNLETIYYLIKDWEQPQKSAFVRKLGERLMVCATGAHEQLSEIVYELTLKPSLAAWLAELRRNIVHQFAENWIKKHRINDSYSIHVHHFCLEYAQKKNWNIPGFESISGYDDRFKPSSLNEDTEVELEVYFAKEFSFKNIIDNIVVNYNLLLAPYYKSEITCDANTNIRSILKPFLDHEIFNLSEIYSFDPKWCIKAEFKNHLPNYVRQLLVKEEILKSQMPQLVERKIIPLLQEEIARLEKKYGRKDARIAVLENSINFFLQTVTDEKKDHETAIKNHLKDIYLNKPLDKYGAFWQKTGLMIANILMLLPLGIPGAIKYATTGSFFFSKHGKTQDMMDALKGEFSNPSSGLICQR